MSANMQTAAAVNRMCWIARPPIANAKALPAAGGCSVLVSTMMKIARPTAVAATSAMERSDPLSQPNRKGSEQISPIPIQTVCPPSILRGCAVSCLGIANTMKALAPSAATITPFASQLAVKVISPTAKNASKLCAMNRSGLRLNF